MAPSAPVIADWLIERSLNTKSATTVRGALSGVKHSLLAYGRDVELLPDWPTTVQVCKSLMSAAEGRRDLPEDLEWDVSRLVDYWRTQPPNEALELSDLLDKCLCLVMVAICGRPSDVEGICFHSLKVNRPKGWISFRVYGSKTEKGYAKIRRYIPFSPTPSRVCPASALLAYRDESESVRPPSRKKDGFAGIWLSQKRPYNPISAERISNRIQRILSLAGIPFQTRTIRSNAASRLLNNGVPVEMVARIGGWASTETILKYYDRSSACVSAIGPLFV